MAAQDELWREVDKATPINWPSSAECYDLIEKIGIGASAVVWRARCKTNDVIVAIKVLDLEQNANMDEIRKEIALMRLTSHPNVVDYYTSFVNETTLWMVMDVFSGGSCLDIMRIRFPNGFDEPVIAHILKEVLQALHYFHQQGQIHRDIKAANILIDRRGIVKLADFGVAGLLIEHGQKREARQSFVGTPCWMAPEVMEQAQGYNSKADIWSLGITALELAQGHAPFSKYPPMKVILLILQNDPPTLEARTDGRKFSKSFKEFLSLMLQKNPADRASTSELLKHKFVSKTNKTSKWLADTLLNDLPSLGERFRQLNPNENPHPDPNVGYGKAPKKRAKSVLAGVSHDSTGYLPGASWEFDSDDKVPSTLPPPVMPADGSGKPTNDAGATVPVGATAAAAAAAGGAAAATARNPAAGGHLQVPQQSFDASRRVSWELDRPAQQVGGMQPLRPIGGRAGAATAAGAAGAKPAKKGRFQVNNVNVQEPEAGTSTASTTATAGASTVGRFRVADVNSPDSEGSVSMPLPSAAKKRTPLKISTAGSPSLPAQNSQSMQNQLLGLYNQTQMQMRAISQLLESTGLPPPSPAAGAPQSGDPASSATPFQLLAQLTSQVSALMKENEELRKDLRLVRGQLAAVAQQQQQQAQRAKLVSAQASVSSAAPSGSAHPSLPQSMQPPPPS